MTLSCHVRRPPPAARRRWAAALVPMMAAAALLLVLPAATWADWPWSGWFDDQQPVGTPPWWDEHEDEAVFVMGKGYKVDGFDGYFDQNGRPIDRPLTASQAPRPDQYDTASEGLLPGLDPRITYGKVKNAVGLGPDDQIAQAEFEAGEQLFEQQRYSAAADKFQDAADRALNMTIKENALFMTAESHFFDDQYIDARDAYNALAAEYPSTRYLDRLVDRQWEIARYWENYEAHAPDWALTPNAWDKTRPWFDTIGHAVRTYDNIRMNDPTGPRADDALMATASIYFRRGRFDDADYHYTLLRREYPRSDFQFEAHLLGLQTKLRKYQGPDYDGTPLEEAQDLVVQLRRNFAGRLSAEERDRLKTVSAQLNHELAQRDMSMATYYEGTEHYGAAKRYYAEVINKFPESELAEDARQRYAAINTEPEVPPKRLAWFVDLFPESAERKAVANVPEIRAQQTRLAEARQSNDSSAESDDSPASPPLTR